MNILGSAVSSPDPSQPRPQDNQDNLNSLNPGAETAQTQKIQALKTPQAPQAANAPNAGKEKPPGLALTSVPVIFWDHEKHTQTASEEEYRQEIQRLQTELNALIASKTFVPSPRVVVALDIDGTLVDGQGQITQRMRQAVCELKNYAHIVISTGRSVLATLPVIQALGLDKIWAICSNGAVIIRYDSGLEKNYEIVSLKTFDARQAANNLRKVFPEALFAVEDAGIGFRATAQFPNGELIETVAIEAFEDLFSREITRLILRAPHYKLPDFKALIETVDLSMVEYAIGWTSWLDVNAPGLSKASALDLVCQSLGLSPANVLAVGDGSNDIEMLKWAGCAVAMKGGCPELKTLANLQVASVRADGCASVLRALTLILRESKK